MQQVNQIISSATIITITDLKKGNVVKIIDTEYSEKKLKYGIVTDILRDKDDCYVSILTFGLSYSDVELKTKVLIGKDNFAIFPATKEEVNAEFAKIEGNLRNKVADKEKELQEYKSKYELAKSFISNHSAIELTEPVFKIEG